MVKGLDLFRDYFRDFPDSYVLIGGVACDLAMSEAGLEFRATKDLDIVLCAEAIDAAFARKFWEFVKEGGYQHQEKSTGKKQFYRFSKPQHPEFPYMLELFSRKPDQLTLHDDSHLTPIPVDEDVSSLSAILLDEEYYQCIADGKVVIDDISILGPEYILPFKAKAWLDLSARKANGESVDSKTIRKHRSDVFRLFALLSPAQRVSISDGIKADLSQFIDAMPQEAGLDIKQLGISQMPLEEVLQSLRQIYQLESQ